MNVDVKINQLRDGDQGKIKAIARIDLDNMIRISNIRVIEGENGLFVAYPQRQNQNGEYQNLIDFYDKNESSKEQKKEIEKEILKAYGEAKENPELVGYKSEFSEEDKQVLKELAVDNLGKISVYMNPQNFSDSKQKGVGSILLDNTIILKNIRLMEGQNQELFVSMPSESYEKDGQKNYRDIFYGLTKEVKDAISEKAIKSYSRNLEEQQVESNVEEDEMEI